MDSAEIFELRIKVLEDDIDALGHVNNVVYLKWVQDAAVAHWQATADPRDQSALRWVVIRHEIDYKRASFMNDEIVARTWVGTAKLLAFDRHTELYRAEGMKLLARARTVWCPISVVSGRPTNVSDRVRERFSVGDSVE